MDGIEIPREIADAEGVPDDLDSGVVGPYVFPSPTRRTTAGLVYAVAALLAAGAALAGLGEGFWLVTIGFAALTGVHLLAAHRLEVDQAEALDRAGAAVDFAVGHASAALAFVGWRSRPVWNVILYAASEPPDQRALVQIDATSGAVVTDPYTEPLAPEFLDAG